MKLVIRRQPLTQILRSSRCVLFGCAIVLLGYYALVWIDGWMYQNREERVLANLLRDRTTRNGEAHPAESLAIPMALAAMNGGLVGRIEIPRLRISVIVIEGTSGATLRRAVGHIPGTSLPGQVGNVGISGHRDTFFRSLRNIHQNDLIVLTTLLGQYRYRVVSTRIVRPNDVAVLDPSENEVLTLVTCYPFYFVGAAPDRFIIRADRVI